MFVYASILHEASSALLKVDEDADMNMCDGMANSGSVKRQGAGETGPHLGLHQAEDGGGPQTSPPPNEVEPRR